MPRHVTPITPNEATLATMGTYPNPGDWAMVDRRWYLSYHASQRLKAKFHWTEDKANRLVDRLEAGEFVQVPEHNPRDNMYLLQTSVDGESVFLPIPLGDKIIVTVMAPFCRFAGEIPGEPAQTFPEEGEDGEVFSWGDDASETVAAHGWSSGTRKAITPKADEFKKTPVDAFRAASSALLTEMDNVRSDNDRLRKQVLSLSLLKDKNDELEIELSQTKAKLSAFQKAISALGVN